MTLINVGNSAVTLINVFTVQPEKADELVMLLDKATEQVVCFQPGFVSANIHRGFNGRHVTNYAQWRTMKDFEAMQGNPVGAHECRRPACGQVRAGGLCRGERPFERLMLRSDTLRASCVGQPDRGCD